MVVCKYFLRGNCKFGRNCKNEHPMQNSSQGSFGFSKKGPGEWSDPFQARKVQSPFSNSFGNFKSKDYVGQGMSQDPFRSSSKASGNGFYRHQRSNVAMDVSSFNEDARGRGRVTYQRGRGRASYQEHALQNSGNWTKEADNDWMEVSWPFTCYGIEENPNILDGDISFEELRTEAYAAALQGIGLNEIVQRERDLATEYRNRHPSQFSKTANPNIATGIVPKDPFGRTTTENPNSHPFQTSNTFGSHLNSQGGFSSNQ
ncbi:zinc finger (CCCH-type) family protein isoform 1 [Galdieria sulphuraria]|uniref:Zinc finger (CCCH-type) family protein isoform 1 n=1 Tax=Galdieria sulphuraria TaxID=130081 RepID=M2XCN7_GALSU|nr:zinc finger (CCCH-type) family protein isoform 1 [Galdieria sulphuraria]EME27712.1 zinc finger (CCCH-type) family protein isoform 1 [Galdieria sulphuraria]|eukprot:XP_005704232.1 zinc finger (CCCH-type) family protein isoform 1 [Galdieria sulphuraria]